MNILKKLEKEINKNLAPDYEEEKDIKNWQDFPKTEMETEWAKGGIRYAKRVILNIIKEIKSQK